MTLQALPPRSLQGYKTAYTLGQAHCIMAAAVMLSLAPKPLLAVTAAHR